MKRFLKLLALFLAPILIIGIASEILLRKIPNDYLYKRNYLDSNSKNIEILFLGSSHTFFGINPDYIHSRAFNASHVSQSLRYDLEILEKYKDSWDSLKCIVLPVDYFSLYTSLEKGEEAWRVKNYSIYYDINTTNYLTDKTELLSNKLNVNIHRIYNFYIKDTSGITCSKLGWGTNYSSSTKVDLISSGKKAAKKHTIRSDQYFIECVEYLKLIIEFANIKGIRVLMFTSPAYSTYVQALDSTQLNRTRKTVVKLVENHGNSIYFDLLEDKVFTEKDFYDADHLNEIGAKKLTLKLDSLITTFKQE